MESVAYEREFFAPLFAVEDRHFWFRARNRIIAAVLEQIVRELRPGYQVLEVGCGTGNVLQTLTRVASGGRVVGMDLFAEGLRFARRRSTASVVQADLGASPFNRRFEVVGAFDVIEHLAEEAGILRCLYDLVAPEGRLLVTVPANASLWSYFDEVAHHRRRYSVDELTRKLAAARFDVEYCSQYMTILYPLAWARRRLASMTRSLRGRDERQIASEELTIVPGINGLLTFLLTQEARWIARRKRLPLGTSLLAVARKPR